MFRPSRKDELLRSTDQLQGYQTLGCWEMLRWMHKSFENEGDVFGPLR